MGHSEQLNMGSEKLNFLQWEGGDPRVINRDAPGPKAMFIFFDMRHYHRSSIM